MEKWQREHIKENLPALLQTTVINQIVLITLRAERILSQGDINELEEEAQKNGVASQVLKFYAILQAKGNNTYDTLIQALRNSRQSDAAVTILESVSPPGSPLTSDRQKEQKEQKEETNFNVQKGKSAFSESTPEKVHLRIESATGGMEKWQRVHIMANIDTLKEKTVLGAPLYAQLIGKGLLNTKDILELETELNTGKKSLKFYEIMQTKGNNAYDKLADAMDQSGMSAVTAILKKANKPALF